MTEPTTMRRCDQCAHVDHMPGTHPMRCKHPAMDYSLAVSLMRGTCGACGPDAVLWISRDKARKDTGQC